MRRPVGDQVDPTVPSQQQAEEGIETICDCRIRRWEHRDRPSGWRSF
jgi:hypothetical protein